MHALVIPTGHYKNAHDFTTRASTDEIVSFWKGVNTTIESLNVAQKGYRLITNTGTDGRQDVPHFHIHILGGQDLGPKIIMS